MNPIFFLQIFTKYQAGKTSSHYHTIPHPSPRLSKSPSYFDTHATTRTTQFLTTFNINGKKLASEELVGKISTIKTIGMKLLTAEGLDNNVMKVRSCVNLEIYNEFPLGFGWVLPFSCSTTFIFIN